MATFTARLDFAAVLEPPDRCPACGRLGLQALPGTDAPIFRCPVCDGCWRFAQGRFYAVDRDCQPP